jgi:hypothetical protein
MSFELKSKSDDSKFSFSGTGWSFCLILAEQFGWVPEGTKKPKGFGLFKKWSGNYDSSEGQYVSSSDAMKIADSIEAALKSETLEVQAKNVASMIEEGVRKALGELPASYKVQAEVNDGFMSYYQDFVSFCRKGSFSIN